MIKLIKLLLRQQEIFSFQEIQKLIENIKNNPSQIDYIFEQWLYQHRKNS